jgi:hypothetical protein
MYNILTSMRLSRAGTTSAMFLPMHAEGPDAEIQYMCLHVFDLRLRLSETPFASHRFGLKTSISELNMTGLQFTTHTLTPTIVSPEM